ncbi:glycosyltransferase family 39 protein [Pseudomonas silvicola]|nr:glycosyltransferase family 39 protein [Pseudomonas silvicola]
MNTFPRFLHAERGALALLLGFSAIALLLGLGQRELWGAETRWATIALQMLQSGDYFDPYLKGAAYYDKPLPSYWLITASASLFGGLGHWSLRLPSVIAAWLSIWLVYLLGEQLFRRGTGLIAGWLLATTFYFLVWARVATADVLTVFGVLAAVWWYWRGPLDTRFSRYATFFLILALTSLLKGLIGFILPGLMLLPHLLGEGRWKTHLNLRLPLAMALALALYMLPFLLSHLYGQPAYGESGLALVVRENLVRFFQPFDNFGPAYTYLLYLPVYTLPWAPCWIIAVWLALRHWRHTDINVRWLVMGLGLMFLFFTACGSRRSYYVLPLVPFAQLLGAAWLCEYLATHPGRARRWGRGIGASALVMTVVVGVAYPWSNGNGGIIEFGREVQARASLQAPWRQWHLVMIDVDNKLPLYVQNQGAPYTYIGEDEDYPRQGTSADFMAWLAKRTGQAWDPARTLIFAQYPTLKDLPLRYLAEDHDLVLTRPDNGARLLRAHDNQSVAFIPRNVPATVAERQP